MRLALAALLLLAAILPAAAQPGDFPPPPPPEGGPAMMFPWMMGAMGNPEVTMMIADGVVYVACGGKLMAFEARTLNKLGEATYWEPPQMPPWGMAPGGAGAPPPPPPPPPAP